METNTALLRNQKNSNSLHLSIMGCCFACLLGVVLLLLAAQAAPAYAEETTACPNQEFTLSFSSRVDQDFTITGAEGLTYRLTGASAIILGSLSSYGKTYTCTIPNPGSYTLTVTGSLGGTLESAVTIRDHDYSINVPAVAATCTTAGKTAGLKCSYCSTVTGVSDVAALGHDYSVPVEAVAPTCTEAGSTAGHKCSRCGIAQDVTTVPATGHTPKLLEAVQPTYDATGLTEGSVCEVCGTTLVGQQIVPQLERKAQKLKVKTSGKLKIALGKALQVKVAGAKTKLTFKKKSGSSVLSVSKAGKIKVSKKAKSGKTYKIKIEITAVQQNPYAASSVTKTFSVRVK